MQKIKVSDIAKQVRGVSYKTSDVHDELNDNSVILLRANNISDGTINFDDVVYVDKSKVSKEQYLQYGDILVCASSGSKYLVGKAASVSFDTPCTFGAFCKVVRPNEKYTDYLGTYFQSDIYRRRISELALGANINNIRNEHIDSLELPLYNDDITHSFVKKIATIQSIITHRKQQLAKLDELIKARFVEMFGDTEINGNNFPIRKLCEVCTVSSSKRIYQEEQSSSGVPFLRISNLVELIDNDRFGSELFIPEEKYNQLLSNGLVPKTNDILVTSRGTLGKCYIIQDNDKFYFQDGMISWLYNLDNSITALYLTKLFDTRHIKKQIDNLQSGSTVAYLSIAMLKKLNIVVPPLELQEQFAAFVAQTDKSKVAVQKALDEAQLLFDSLMQEYFG